MHAQGRPPRCYVFSFPRLDTVVEVEALEDSVIIHASRDSFSPARKACFLHELAAEGFIAEEYASPWPAAAGPVRWLVEPVEFMPGPPQRAQTNRFMLRLFFSAAGLWLLMMGVLLLTAAR